MSDEIEEDQLEEQESDQEEDQEDVEDIEDTEDEDASEDDPEGDQESDADEDDEGKEDDGTFVVDLSGGEKKKEEESLPIQFLRRKTREQERRIKELEGRIKDEPVKLGPKPQLSDFEYDTDKHEEALLAWHEQKRQIDTKKQEQQEREDKQRRSYERKFDAYTARKAEIEAPDFEEAEELVRGTLPVPMQSLIVSHAEDPAVMVYALGKRPELLEDLASASDLAEAGYKLGKMESRMRVAKRERPAPETRVKGGKSARPRSLEQQLAKAEEKAEQTGDRTEVLRIRKKIRERK